MVLEKEEGEGKEKDMETTRIRTDDLTDARRTLSEHGYGRSDMK